MAEITLFSKEYDGESLCDLSRDIHEAFDVRLNPAVAIVPTDEHGFQQGMFKVSVEWIKEGDPS